MQDPGRYDNNKSPATKDTDDFLPALIDAMHFDQNQTILDYGCGPGGVTWKYFAPLAAKYNSTVHAVDISDNMVRYAQKKYPHPHVHYMQGDVQADRSPIQDMKFNHIFSIYVFHFIKDYRRALRTFHDMLTPGGDIAFIVLGKHEVFAVLERVANDPKWSLYMKNYRDYLPEWQETDKPIEACFKETMLDVGYDEITLDTHIRTFKHNFETMIELYYSLNPFLKQIPEDLTPALKKDYRRHIAEMHNVDESVEFVTAEHEMLVGLASKGDVNGNSIFRVKLNLN